MVNWEVEKQVWDYMFGKEKLKVDIYEVSLFIANARLKLIILNKSLLPILNH